MLSGDDDDIYVDVHVRCSILVRCSFYSAFCNKTNLFTFVI